MALPAGLAQAQQAMPAPPPTTIRASDDVTTPRVTSVVPGILVPVDRDITRPFQAPRSRIERAKSVLEGIEFYRQGGIQGMLHLAAIEQKRILREAHRWEAMYGLDDSDATMQRDEEEALVASMSAPAVPGVDYNISTAELSKLSFNRAVDKGDRRDTVRQLQRVVEDVMTHLHGYDNHMEGLRKKWTESLEREERRMEEQFGPVDKAPSAASAPTASSATGGRDGDGDIFMG